MNKMKRILAFFLTVAMVLGMSVNAFASNGVTIQLISSNTTPVVGEEFSVDVEVLTGHSGFNGYEFYVSYNENAVEFLGYEEDDGVVKSDISGFMIGYDNAAKMINAARTANTTGTGTLFTMKFKTIAAGDADICFSSAEMCAGTDATVINLTVDDSATKDLTIYQTYTVTTEDTKYTVIPTEESVSPVKAGESYSFTIELDNGYVQGAGFKVKANNDVLTADDNGVYTIANINENKTISVEGIVEDIPEEGYVVSLTQDAKGKVPGETAQVNVVVNSKEYNAFNAFYAELSYDPQYLKLKNSTNSVYTVEDNNGAVQIVAYGEDKALGNALTLNFEVKETKDGGISVTLEQANVDVSDHAVGADAPEAELGDEKVVFVAGEYSVALHEWFQGDSTIVTGEDYTFKALDKNYNYTFTATMGDSAVEVIDNRNGTFTIKNVTGNLNIAAKRTAKEFNVEVNGAQENQVTYAEKAVYGTSYSFNVAAVEGHNTTVSVTIGGENYTGFSTKEGKYTIPGEDITGNVIITVVNTASTYTWIFIGDDTGEATTTMESLSHGEDFVFTVREEDGFEYTITALMGGKIAEVKFVDGEYVIKNVKGNLEITIGKTATYVPEIKVENTPFVKVEGETGGANVQMVTVSAKNLPEEKTLTYNGKPMYWSEKYGSFVYLKFLLATDLVTADAENPVAVVDGDRIVVDYSGNVNGTSNIDVNDAQLVYDIYNAKYTDFNTVTMYKFLCADVNGDKEINVNDAAAIVNTITTRN